MKKSIFFSHKVHYLNYSTKLLNDKKLVSEIRENLLAGDILIIKNFTNKDLLHKIVKYLTRIGQSSLPNYNQINFGAPNSHRINREDRRSYVKGCFHQFSFYPWNQDLFDFFKIFKPIFQLKNLLSQLPIDSFLENTAQDNCTARLAFQFYPSGMGYLNKHTDPVDYHQLVVPTMLLSKKGKDFHDGGAYVLDINSQKHFLDDLMDIGDVLFFNAQIIHGVEIIDPMVGSNWLDFRGRWMLLFAINKFSNNSLISPSVDLGN